MEIKRIPRATRVLALEQRQYLPLPIRDVDTDGVNVMWAMFRPTAEELLAMNNGHPVMLGIMGIHWPPVLLAVSENKDGD